MTLDPLRDTLLLGSYVFSAWIYRQLQKLTGNHVRSLEKRVTALEAHRDGKTPDQVVDPVTD